MRLHKLTKGKANGYTTWGCLWDKGECRKDTEYICRNENGEVVPLQSRVTAYWPDGSVKWTAHTADSTLLGEKIEVLPREPLMDCGEKNPESGIRITETEKEYRICGGKLEIVVSKRSNYLFENINYDGKECALHATLELLLENPVTVEDNPAKIERKYQGRIDTIEIEESGNLQAILKFSGIHTDRRGDEKFPFILRMRVNFNDPRLHFMHTFLYDGDEDQDFLKGIGISFQTPVAGKLYNRHLKFAGDNGVFHEAVVPFISWRPRVPAGLYERQMAGECLTLSGDQDRIAEQILKDTPYWDTYDICQDSATHFAVRKKLADANCCYINALHGQRSVGGLSFGSEAGSCLVSIRDFWQKYPSGYTICGLSSDRVTCKVWFWSPSAPVMDFRHYANRGYNQVCYEGYDYKGASADGIACTNECTITFMPRMIPDDDTLVQFAETENDTTLFVADPEFYHEKQAFGIWSLPSYETETLRWLEEQLEGAFLFYKNEVEQRGWYGMFDYGDFMHTYDSIRHQWRYDIGGYAWDNTELVPTLWLWLYFMRTGREDVFRLAEKLSRHASEVDVYHMGKYKGLGSRHNVRHWGCPCKEARIAMAAHHRYYYYLTGDRRLEDIFEELKDNEISFYNRDPLGDFYEKDKMVYPSHARSGPDWSSLCSNWMTEWERFGDVRYRDKILVGLRDIKKAPLQLVSGPDFEFDPASCHLRYIGERTTGGTHLQICMGAPSVWMELAELLEDEEFRKMIADYGRFYYLPKEEQQRESKGLVGDREFSLPFMAAAMGAYGAKYYQDDVLAMRTWRILLHTLIHEERIEGFTPQITQNCGNHEKLSEIEWITTNFTAQFCLNTIMVLDLIREKLPTTISEVKRLVADMDISTFHKA